MNLTKKQAIEEHRKMWNWIANEIRKTNTLKDKDDYLRQYQNGLYFDKLEGDCFCCEYAGGICNKCPILWGTEKTQREFYCLLSGLYGKWYDAKTIKERADIAEQIANLPVRED